MRKYLHLPRSDIGLIHKIYKDIKKDIKKQQIRQFLKWGTHLDRKFPEEEFSNRGILNG